MSAQPGTQPGTRPTSHRSIALSHLRSTRISRPRQSMTGASLARIRNAPVKTDPRQRYTQSDAILNHFFGVYVVVAYLEMRRQEPRQPGTIRSTSTNNTATQLWRMLKKDGDLAAACLTACGLAAHEPGERNATLRTRIRAVVLAEAHSP